eukprot:4762957-Prymnesium_polylepis.1
MQFRVVRDSVSLPVGLQWSAVDVPVWVTVTGSLELCGRGLSFLLNAFLVLAYVIYWAIKAFATLLLKLLGLVNLDCCLPPPPLERLHAPRVARLPGRELGLSVEWDPPPPRRRSTSK